MPSGRTHETLNLVALGAVVGLYAYARGQGLGPQLDVVAPPPARLLFFVCYLVGTFLVTPDLDLAERSVRAKSNWGVMGLLWIPYGLLFRHRGLSHSWLVGPLTRLAYMVALALAFAWLAGALGPFLGYRFSLETQLLRNGPELAWGALTGYYLSQWMHLVADGHYFWKRRSGRRKRR